MFLKSYLAQCLQVFGPAQYIDKSSLLLHNTGWSSHTGSFRPAERAPSAVRGQSSAVRIGYGRHGWGTGERSWHPTEGTGPSGRLWGQLHTYFPKFTALCKHACIDMKGNTFVSRQSKTITRRPACCAGAVQVKVAYHQDSYTRLLGKFYAQTGKLL